MRKATAITSICALSLLCAGTALAEKQSYTCPKVKQISQGVGPDSITFTGYLQQNDQYASGIELQETVEGKRQLAGFKSIMVHHSGRVFCYYNAKKGKPIRLVSDSTIDIKNSACYLNSKKIRRFGSVCHKHRAHCQITCDS